MIGPWGWFLCVMKAGFDCLFRNSQRLNFILDYFFYNQFQYRYKHMLSLAHISAQFKELDVAFGDAWMLLHNCDFMSF